MNRFDVLDALNQVDEAQIEATGRFFENGKEQAPMRKTKTVLRTVLIAAAITVLLSVTAYAAGIFALNGRETEPEESFPVSFYWGDGETLSGEWTGTYALEFESPAECPPVRYRFGWLPDELEVPKYYQDGDGWIKRSGKNEPAGYIPWQGHTELWLEENHELFLVSDMYYAPQFVDGGALILMNAVPEEIEEETWGELSVLRFTSNGYRSYQDEFIAYEDMPRHYVVLFHPEQGWIFALRGTVPMEDLVKIAQELEIEQTDGLVEHGDFENPYDFFDASRG